MNTNHDSPWKAHSLPQSLLPMFALALLTATNHAQFDGGGNSHSFDLYPGTGELGVSSASAAGHLYGELGIDALVLFDETPMVFKAPEVYRARTDLQVVANDLTIYPRFPANGPDWIFVAGPAGLTRWVWDGARFVDTSPRDQSGSIWIGASEVGSADLDGNASKDLYVVNADRTQVMLSRAVNDIWNNYLPVAFSEILAVEPVKWDPLNFHALAIRTLNQLVIIDFSGVELHSRSIDASGELMRVVEIPGVNNQAVLVFSDGALGPHQWLNVLSSTMTQPPIDLGSIGTVGIQLGDFDLDLDTDFVLSHTSGATLELWGAELVDEQLTFSQSLPETHITVPQWFSSELNEATPAVADFDNDSDPDVLFAPVGTDRIDVNANTTFDETTLMCTVKAGAMTLEAEGGLFQITLNVPPVASVGGPGWGNPWTDVKLTIWRQPRFDYYLLSDPFIATSYHPIVSDEVYVPIQTPYYEWFEDIYHIEVRLVERSNGATVAQGPGYTAMVGLAEPINALWEIEGLPSGGDFHGVTFVVPPEFEYPFQGGTAAHPSETLGNGGSRLPGPGPLGPPIPPVGGADPDGLPNPLFEGHEVKYDHDEAGGTWGGGSGCLPDLPKTQINFPPLG